MVRMRGTLELLGPRIRELLLYKRRIWMRVRASYKREGEEKKEKREKRKERKRRK